MLKRQGNQRLLILLLIGLGMPLVSRWLISRLPNAQYLELLAYDWHYRALPKLQPDPRIVLIGMDDATLDALPRTLLPRASYPLPRTLHSQLVDKLREAGARVIGFDVMFTRSVPAEDKIFAEALRRHGNVVSAVQPEVNIVAGVETFTFTEPAPLLRPHLRAASILVARRFGKARWFVSYPADHQTSRRYLHLPLALAAAYFGDANRVPRIRNTLELGRIIAPIGQEGEILTRYAGPSGTFQTIPYYQVFNGDWKEAQGANFFRDKIVLIGRVSKLEDRHDTPLGEMQGVEILAHETQTVLQGNWLRHWSEAANYLAKAGLCLILIVVLWKMGLRLALAVTLIEAVLWVIISHQLFIRTGVWADTVEPIIALFLTYIVATGVEARRLRRVFQRFLPRVLADQALTTELGVAATTVGSEATVVFCDVRNYTAMCEELPSEQIEELLRLYFAAGDEAAERFGEELDKYVGDEIMLHFEPRAGLEPHAVRAVRWGLAMQEAAAGIHASGVAGNIGFHVGIGICSGPVRVGTVGARRRLQPTVIGDAVNVASRLQELTKAAGRDIIIAESTWSLLGDSFETELIGDVSVRGKRQPIRVYCPLGAVEHLNRDSKTADRNEAK